MDVFGEFCVGFVEDLVEEGGGGGGDAGAGKEGEGVGGAVEGVPVGHEVPGGFCCEEEGMAEEGEGV